MNQKLLPIYYDDKRGYVICVAVNNIIWTTCVLPVSAFLFCVIWSLLYDFEETTVTHCKVMNYLPSLSAAIGNHIVQQLVWTVLITLHSPTRFLITFLYKKRLDKILEKRICMTRITLVLSIFENISLLGLTYFTSASFYPIHATFFLLFILSSQVHMILTCTLFGIAKRNQMDKTLCRSFYWKMRLMCLNIISFIVACYFFVRHNAYCEPGVYTLFALFEYMLVMSNISYHLTAVIDFQNVILVGNTSGYDLR